MASLHRPFTGKSIIEEIHEGSYGFNTEPRSMVVKVTKQVWESATRRAITFVVRSSMKLGQRSDLVKSKPTFSLSTKAFPLRLFKAWQSNIHPQVLRSPSKPDRNEGDRGVMKVSALNWNISVMNMTKKETWNQDLFESGKPLQFSARSLQGPGDRERVVEFEDAPNRDGSRVERKFEAHLWRSENDQPLQSSLTSVYGGHQPSTDTSRNLPPNGTSAYYPYGGYASQAPTGNTIPDPHGFMYPSADPSNNYLSYTQPILSSNRRIKMPSYMGSYDEKGDPDKYLHLFEGVIRMMKWAMPVACHMFTYTLKDSVRIWWNGQKACSILNYEDLKAEFRYTYDTLQILGLREEQRIFGFVHGLKTRSLVEFLSIDLQTTYKGLMEKTYT
ncbi:hypothetical protein Tco_0603368 [Tanacetum coccineum]